MSVVGVCCESGIYGLIPNVKAKGTAARVALQRFMNLKKLSQQQAFPGGVDDYADAVGAHDHSATALASPRCVL